MSTFVISRNILILWTTSLLLADLFFLPVKLWLYVIPIAIFLILITVGSSVMSLHFFLKSYQRFDTRVKEIAITFDDGPHEKFTPAILELLEKYGAKATFFCIGKYIEENKSITKKIVQNGHVVGNHSFSHSNFFSFFGKRKVKQEIILTNKLILETTGTAATIFRPPYGVTNPPIAAALKSIPLKTVGWSIRSFDTSTSDPKKIMNNVISRIKPGAIILLHDNRKQSIEILEAILLYTKNNHYKCISLSEKVTLK